EKLVRDEEALSVTELAQLGRHHWEDPPTGYLHLGKWLAEPHDLVISARFEDTRRERIEQMLEGVFGDAYSQQGKRSQLPSRLGRMRSEVDLGKETFEKKLRYLLWVN